MDLDLDTDKGLVWFLKGFGLAFQGIWITVLQGIWIRIRDKGLVWFFMVVLFDGFGFYNGVFVCFVI